METKKSRIESIGQNGNDGLHYRTINHYDGWDYGVFAFKHEYDLFQFNVGKYLHRHKKKNGRDDLVKARNYLDKYIELYYGKEL